MLSHQIYNSKRYQRKNLIQGSDLMATGRDIDFTGTIGILKKKQHNFNNIFKEVKSIQRYSMKKKQVFNIEKQKAEIYGLKDNSPSKKSYGDKEFER